MLFALVGLPLLWALIALVVPSQRWRPWLLPLGSAMHLGLTALILCNASAIDSGKWLVIDPLGKLVLGFLSLLFFLSSTYAPGYLNLRSSRPNRWFCSCLFIFLAMMSLAVMSQHVGLMWVAIEACTLSSAPLIYFNQNVRSLEATWKYLLIGSVGIALALWGSFFLAYSALHGGMTTSLFFNDLVQAGPHLSLPWLRSAFVVLIIGYGTKMGLAPVHAWKPDVYGEAPGLVGALLSGGLTSCAFLAILRFYRICNAAGEGVFARQIMIVIGLLSMAVAGVFLARQRDYKRMLAYSSVEHMGILVLGMGIGGLGVYGSLLHIINNGFAKGVLFLAAANTHRAYGSKLVSEVRGVIRRLPITGSLFLAGFFAISGSPPFGPFFSEFTIVRAAFSSGQFIVGGLFLLILFVVFMGISSTVLAILPGEPSLEGASKFKDGFFTVAPLIAMVLLVLILGIYLPAPLNDSLHQAARFLEGKS